MPADLAALRSLLTEGKQVAQVVRRGPWHWYSDDGSFLGLSGPDEMRDHVLWSAICDACRQRGGRCTAPNDADAAFIAWCGTHLGDLLALAELALQDSERLDWLARNPPNSEMKPMTSISRDQIDASMRAARGLPGAPQEEGAR